MGIFQWLFGTGIESAGKYFDRGLNAIQSERYYRAIKELTKAIRADPSNAVAYGNRSYAYSMLGDFERAITDCNSAIDLNPDAAGAYGNRGIAWVGKGEFVQAIADFDRALQLDPTMLPAYMHRGSTHAETDDHKRAIADFTKALELDPTLDQVYYNRGFSYYCESKYDEAIADCRETLRLNPNHSKAPALRARALRAIRFSRLEEFTAPKVNSTQVEQIRQEQIGDQIQKCIDASRTLNSYRSTLFVKDLLDEDFKPYDNEIIKWRFEFLRPATLYVTQDTRLENFPDGGFDEWTIIGEHHYEIIGPNSINSDSDIREEIDRFLAVEKYVQLLESPQFTSAVIHRLGENEWLLLEYSLNFNAVFGGWRLTEIRSRLARSLWHSFGTLRGDQLKLFSIPIVSSEPARSIAKYVDLLLRPEHFSCRCSLWIDTKANQIGKAQFDVVGQLENGEPVSLRLEQVFGDYNGDVLGGEYEGLIIRPIAD